MAKIAGGVMAGMFGGWKFRKAHHATPKTNGNGHDFKGEWIDSVDLRLGELSELQSQVTRMNVEFGFLMKQGTEINGKLDDLSRDLNSLRIALGAQRTN